MRVALFAAALISAVSVSASAEAKTYRTSHTMSGVVEANGRMFAGPFTTIDSHCRSTTTAAITILQRPRHGTVRLTLGNGEIEMGGRSNLSRCNDLQTRGSFVVYTPHRNFRGTDTFRVLLRFEDGEHRTVTFPFIVK